MEIQGYPNYLIYEDGRVWSNKSNRYLKPTPNQDGYLQLCLRDGKREKKFSVARLVALHYVPNPNNHPTVDHIDRNRNDNRVCNLRWADRRMQMENRGLFKNNKSGFKNICYDKKYNRWIFSVKRTKVLKYFKTKTDAICYKYIHNLREKAGHYD